MPRLAVHAILSLVLQESPFELVSCCAAAGVAGSVAVHDYCPVVGYSWPWAKVVVVPG